MKTKVLAFLGTLCVFLIAAPDSRGQPGPEAGFSGRIEAGVGYASSTDQLGTASENEKNDDLNDEADRYDRFIPLVLFELRYAFQSGTALYLGTPFEAGGAPPFALGVAQSFGDGSELDVSIFVEPFGEVWEDPYLEGVDRDETARRAYGVKVDYHGILGTGLGLTYSYAQVDVEDDDVGDRFRELERDGRIHQVGVEYALRLGASVTLGPGFEYTKEDLDGDANSFDGVAARLALHKFSENYGATMVLSAQRDEYDETHPVFGETREDDTFSVFGLFTLFNLFGNEHLFSDVLAGYSYRNSDIAFFDARTFFSGLTVGYRLGGTRQQ